MYYGRAFAGGAPGIELAARGRSNGIHAPFADWLIFACARARDLEPEHDDAHFAHIEGLAASPGNV